MPTKKKTEEFKIEDAFARLEEITRLLANPETDLKTSMELYTEGVKLSELCKENLEGVAKEIKVLSGEEL